MASAVYKIYAHHTMNTCRRKKFVVHRFRGQFFGMGVRETWNSLQHDAEDWFNLDEFQISNFGKVLLVDHCAPSDFNCEGAGVSVNIITVG